MSVRAVDLLPLSLPAFLSSWCQTYGPVACFLNPGVRLVCDGAEPVPSGEQYVPCEVHAPEG